MPTSRLPDVGVIMISWILGFLIGVYIFDSALRAVKNKHKTIKDYSARELRDLYWATTVTPITLFNWWEREKTILAILYEMEERGEKL